MAKKAKAGKKPSEMTGAELTNYLDGAATLIARLRMELAQAEANTSTYRAELASRYSGNDGDVPAPTRRGRKAKGAMKAAKAKAGDPSEAEVNAIKGDVLEAIPASGKGVTAKDVRVKLNKDSRLVELAFSALYKEGKIKRANEKARGRYRAMVRA